MAEISMWPMDKGMSVSPHVARVLDVIDRSGLSYRLGPLGTTIEGEVDEVLDLVRKCHAVLEEDCDRIACTIKMDWRRGPEPRLEAKVKAVEEKLGRKLRT